MFLSPIRTTQSVVGYQVLDPANETKSCSGARFMSVDGNPISIQSIKAYENGAEAPLQSFDITYYNAGAFVFLTWCDADSLVEDDGETPCGYAGWGDPETGIVSKKTFSPGEMFLVQPNCEGTPSLNISGSVKQYSSDLAIASVLYDNETKVATGSPFPIAHSVQEVKAYDDGVEAALQTFDLIYFNAGAFIFLTWCDADSLVEDDGETPCGYAGWGDPETGIVSKKQFTSAEGFLLQPNCVGQPSLGFVNPFYKGDK